MKNFKFILSAAAATLFLGCSDLSVGENEAIAENFPADFSYQSYVSVHPELRYIQIKADVDEHNLKIESAVKELANRRSYASKGLPNSIKKNEDTCNDDSKTEKQRQTACAAADSLTKELVLKQDTIKMLEESAVVKAYMADTARLFADSMTMHSMFVNPFVGGIAGYTEEDWAKNWNRTDTVITVDSTMRVDTLKMFVLTTVDDSTIVNPVFLNTSPDDTKGKISYDEKDGKKIIVKLEGYSDSAYTEEVSFSNPEGLKFDTKNRTRTDVKLEKVDTTRTPELTVGLALDKRAFIAGFNYYDEVDAEGNVKVVDDTLMLATAALDTNAIRFQYVLFGKLHGWAYRFCTDDELNNDRGCEEDYALCDAMEDEAAKTTCYSLVKCDMYPTSDFYCMDKATKVSHKIKK